LQPVVAPKSDLTYILTVTGEGGCIGSDTINVAVALAPIVPNAFSPNGDGINDVWYIKYLEFYPGCTINVFDRFGRLVYGSTGYARPWDGLVNGKPMPVGVYYYVIDPKNGKPKMSGSLTLLR
jgi:gliding motility-associated-like protein